MLTLPSRPEILRCAPLDPTATIRDARKLTWGASMDQTSPIDIVAILKEAKATWAAGEDFDVGADRGILVPDELGLEPPAEPLPGFAT